MEAALPLTLAALALASLVVLLDGLVQQRRVDRQLREVLTRIPRDPDTGLFDRRVCQQRLAAELKRAARTDGNVWVGVVTVMHGDADRFGRLAADSLRFPEVGFRLAERVFCVIRPELDDVVRADLIGRLRSAGPREDIAIGEHLWSSPADGDAPDVLRAASHMREVAG